MTNELNETLNNMTNELNESVNDMMNNMTDMVNDTMERAFKKFHGKCVRIPGYVGNETNGTVDELGRVEATVECPPEM